MPVHLRRLFSSFITENAYNAESFSRKVKYCMRRFWSLPVVCSVFSLLLPAEQVRAETGYAHDLDIQARFDDRSDRDHRNQYRLRYYPSWTFDSAERWSINSFVVTGDDFSSSHNTLADGSSEHLYVRRAFVRYQGERGKTEVGVIPTYKGRVSSSGLSKDGWIKGVRQVYELPNNSALEWVAGQLDDTDPAHALDAPDALNYGELEYSARLDERHSYEVSVERIQEGNFIRGEYRWKFRDSQTLFLELVQRLDDPNTKTIAGLSGKFTAGEHGLEYFAHYNYVSEGFGPRAELTEDFLGTGHGVSAELSGGLPVDLDAEWFVRLDVVDSTTRLLTGIAISLDYR